MKKLTKEQKDALDIVSVCAYCEYASRVRNGEEMLCRLRGIVSADHTCRKFRYDLLKRKPAGKLPPAEHEPLPTLDDDD